MNLIPDDTNIDEMRKQVLEASLKGTAKFLNSYIKCNKALEKTLEYVYESDLQAPLYNSIKNSLENCEWNYGEKEWVISNIIPKTKTPCLVHCGQRYNCNGKGRGKAIDIAVWDPTGKNARKDYKQKDLLLLIEIKYRFTAKDAIEAVKKDYKKLMNLKLKEYQKGLALTFTVAEKKLLEEGKLIDVCEILKEKQIQALVACRDGIIEMPVQ